MADCTPQAQASRSVVTALFGAGLGLLLSRTISPTHPVFGAVGGALAGLLYAGANAATNCPPPLGDSKP